jgi:hypothetical protein
MNYLTTQKDQNQLDDLLHRRQIRDLIQANQLTLNEKRELRGQVTSTVLMSCSKMRKGASCSCSMSHIYFQSVYDQDEILSRYGNSP